MYQVPDMALWQGRSDPIDGIRGERWHHRINCLSPDKHDEPGIAIIGFACDEGVRLNQGRPGARQGPNALRRALANLPATLSTRLYDAGNICCENKQSKNSLINNSPTNDTLLNTAQLELTDHCQAVLNHGHRLLLLGGGHEIAWGSFRALQKHLYITAPAESIGIINFDAHFDLRNPQHGGSSGTPFHQIAQYCEQQQIPFNYLCLGVSETANTPALFDCARRLGASWRLDREITPWQIEACRQQLQTFVDSVDWIHLSIDLDVLPAGTMPGVSAPACPGVDLQLIETLLPIITEARHPSGARKMRLAELAEYNPGFDPSAIGAKVAARLVYRLLQE